MREVKSWIIIIRVVIGRLLVNLSFLLLGANDFTILLNAGIVSKPHVHEVLFKRGALVAFFVITNTVKTKSLLQRVQVKKKTKMLPGLSKFSAITT